MKDWIMPQIRVEAFTANEYVAACDQFADNLPSGNLYWDVYTEFLGRAVYNGRGNGSYERQETVINNGDDSYSVNATIANGGFFGTGKQGWNTGVYFYRSTNYNPNNRIGAFSVYVFEDGRTYIYETRMDTNKTPQLNKLFS